MRTASRHGVSLLELLAIIPLIVAFWVIFSALFPALVSDVPAAQRTIITEGQVAGLVRHIRQDMDAATALPASADGRQANAKTLLIQTRQGVICYEAVEGGWTRANLSAPTAALPQTWPLSKAVVAWQAAPDAGTLEVRTAVKVKIRGRPVERLANSYLFFINAAKGYRVPT